MDVLRGFAVLGILWINIFVFAMPYAGGSPLPLLNDNELLNFALFTANSVYLEGSWRGLFSLLFGASALIFLASDKLASGGVKVVEYYYRRNLWLVLFGLLHAYLLLWPYDVLFIYGLIGLLLFPLRVMSTRLLLVVGIVLVLLTDINIAQRSLTDDLGFTQEQSASSEEGEVANPASEPPSSLPELVTAIAEQQATQANPDTSAMEMEVEVIVYRSGFATIYTYQQALVMEMQTSRLYQNFFFDIGGMMLIGMALFKLGALSGQWSRHRYTILALSGCLFGLTVRGVADYLDTSPVDGFIVSADWLNVGYSLGRLMLVFGYVGLLGLLCQVRWLQPLTNLLATVGRMSLTSYIMQTIIAVLLFYGLGLGLFAQLERYQVALVCVAIWVFQLAFSKVWLHYYRQGPLEWLWRVLVYGKWQANRRSSYSTGYIAQQQA